MEAKKLNKATIIGHFGAGLEYYDGQTIKTKKVNNELKRCFGKRNIVTVDTHGGVRHLIMAPIIAWKSLRNSENVIMLPAQNGLKVYAPLLTILKGNKATRLHYIVIGGWIPNVTKRNRLLRKCLMKFDGIYVETKTMKTALEKQGFSNIVIMPNFKEEQEYSNIKRDYNQPYKLCTFSRVMKEKGIEDAVNAVRSVNDKKQKTVFRLDIFGSVDEKQQEWFEKIKKLFEDTICYKGSVKSDESTAVLSEYFALLFPTHFYTEGIPGTIIDAYAAGVPVICSKWESFSDIVDDGITGIGYDFNMADRLVDILDIIADNPNIILQMKDQCWKKFEEYTPNVAMKPLIDGM